MTEFERQRKVADAILLERAWRAMKRRYQPMILTDPYMHAAAEVLSRCARQLRWEAEREDGQDRPAAGSGVSAEGHLGGR